MLPGKLLNTLFPNWQAGTHCSINRTAYNVVARYRQRKQFLGKRALNTSLNALGDTSFPELKAINAHEGFNGIDGLWLQNKHLPSRSSYNPITQEGNGLQELWDQYTVLEEAWEMKNTESIAKQCAYLSHIITDIHTPTHQYGHTIAPKQRWWYAWRLLDDWEDRHHDNHLSFELQLCWQFMRAPIPVRSIDTRLVRTLKRSRHKQSALAAYMHDRIMEINQLRIYPEYIKRGWTKRVQRSMQRRVLPQAVRTVATIWYVATGQGRSTVRLGTRLGTRLGARRRRSLIHARPV